jgi:hypothetical protein
MDSFYCLDCSEKSYVRQVMADAEGTYFVCEHCGAAHTIRKIDTPRNQPSEFEVLGLKQPSRSGEPIAQP